MPQSTKTAAAPPRSSLLVIAHGDGHIAAYAERHIDVCIRQAMTCMTQDAERLADEILIADLPQRYRDLYRADYLRATHTIRPITPHDVAAAQFDRQLLDCLSDIIRSTTAGGEATSWTI